MPGWKRDFLTYPGRDLLLNTVLTSMPIYYLTIFKFPRWAITTIDKFRRGFLWKERDPHHVRGGNCLVNWQTCCRPRKLGGLGIKDLEKFGRALRLRWLWHGWDQCDRPWKQLIEHRDKSDRDLFFASTYITVGDGKNTPFWEANWLNGASPKYLAPNLYEQARFKFRTVAKELRNNNWITGLKELDSQILLNEFALLYTALNSVVLNNEKDRIHWRWTASGQYKASSAYEIQFYGATIMIPAKKLWKAKTEPRCRFFAWLAMHDRVQTANNLMKKNYPCNPTCPLCFCIPETTDHLLTGCNFTEAAWGDLSTMLHLSSHARQINKEGVVKLLLSITSEGDKHLQKEMAGALFYFWWQIWKERNRRIFMPRKNRSDRLRSEQGHSYNLANMPAVPDGE